MASLTFANLDGPVRELLVPVGNAIPDGNTSSASTVSQKSFALIAAESAEAGY